MTTDKNIESILQENRLFPPSKSFVEKSRISSQEQLDVLYKKAADDYEGFWSDLAVQEISWQKPFKSILDSSKAPHFRWFYDGQLNVSYNCLDRHLETKSDKTAIIFEGEKGDTQHISYAELHAKVCRFANALKSLGVKK